MKRPLILLISLAIMFVSAQNVRAQAQWIEVTSGTTNHLCSVIWTDSQFVAVGDGGEVITSPDGVSWTTQNSGSTGYLNCVTWTGNQLVVVGNGGEVITSPDGVSWTTQDTVKPATSGNNLLSVTWTGSQLVAVGCYFSGASSIGYFYTVFTSPDGITWTNTVNQGYVGYYNSITWTGSQLVAVGGNWDGLPNPIYYGMIITSPDANTWTSRGSSLIGFGFYSVIWNNSQLVAVGGYQGNNRPTSGSNGKIFTSLDGITWTNRLSEDTELYCSVTYGNGRYMVVGLSGKILQSVDGINWSYDSSVTTETLYSVSPGNSQCQFVAVGRNGTIIIYADPGYVMVKTPQQPALSLSSLHVQASNSLLTIFLPSSMLDKTVDLAVYSASGRVVMRKRVAAVTERFSLPAAGLATGAYVLSVKDGNRQKAVRFVVTR